MSKNIYATLDLNKSLNNFQLNVTKLLNSSNFTELSGKKFQELESEIRNQALILAGQCIAIFLYKLSINQKVLEYSVEQIQTEQNLTNSKRGYKNRQILTLGNVEVILKLPYVVARNKLGKNSKKRKTESQGFYPFLKWLGMSEGITPLVWSTTAKYGAIAGSFEAARSTLIDWGINISLKRIERLTYLFGQIGINLRQSKILNQGNSNTSGTNILKNQRVVIAVDGGRTKIRFNPSASLGVKAERSRSFNKKGRRSAKTNRHGFVGEWMEPKPW